MMARTIIKQPNGKIMVWSSIVEKPIYTNMTVDDYIKMRMIEEKERAERDLARYMKEPEEIEKRIFIFNMDEEEIEDLVDDLINSGYDEKYIRKIITDQLKEKEEEI